MKEIFLTAPDSQIGESAKRTIRDWDEPSPSPIQMLRTLDEMVHCGEGSGFAIQAIDSMMRGALEAESKSFEELVKEAHWRTPNDTANRPA